MTLGLSDETLMRVGEVTVNAVHLEYMLARFASMVSGTSVVDVMKRTGEARRAGVRASEALAGDTTYDALRDWVADAVDLLDQRNKVVHSVWHVADVAGSELLMEAEDMREEATFGQDAATLAELPRRLGAVAARGLKLMQENL